MALGASALLAAVAAATIAVALASQEHPPQPALAVQGLPARMAQVPAARAEGPTAPEPPVLPPSEPVLLDIPAIGVHSEIQYLGLAENGALEVPAVGPHYDEAAWYKYSPTPGSLGPAIISGHVDSAKQGPSVFFKLGDLRPGDAILVTRADGAVAHFNVDGLRVVPKDDFPTQLVYGNTSYPALRLLTCGGPFDRAAGHYVDNLIVFASLVRPG